MTKYPVLALVGILAGVVSASAMAQSTPGAEKAVATVRTDGGVIMVSDQNAPFATALPNQAVASGDRLMVSKDSIATVIYNDGCEQKYDKAGIYKIQPDCKRAAALLSNGSGWTTGQVALAFAGGAVLGAVVEDRRHKCPPVSR